MNISRQLFGAAYCCLAVFVGCASNRMPSMAELQPRAQNGDAVAQRELGEKFDFGFDAKQDYMEAAKWYQMAANQGDAKAQNNLGSFYQFGLGVATNYSKAFELYKQSAGRNFAPAQNNLGYMYDFGVGVPTNEATADSWYQRAAEQGYPAAMMNLGINYVEGKGVASDLPQGFMWLQMARIFTERSQDIKLKQNILHHIYVLKKHMTPEEVKTGERLANEQYYNFTGQPPLWEDEFR